MEVGKVARRRILAVVGALIACPAAAEVPEAGSFSQPLKTSPGPFGFSRSSVRYEVGDRVQLFLNLKTPKANSLGEPLGRRDSGSVRQAPNPRAMKLGVLIRW